MTFEFRVEGLGSINPYSTTSDGVVDSKGLGLETTKNPYVGGLGFRASGLGFGGLRV